MKKLKYKIKKFYYYSPFLQSWLSICDKCHKLKFKSTVKKRVYYGIPGITTGKVSMTSRNEFCNKCHKTMLALLKESLPK